METGAIVSGDAKEAPARTSRGGYRQRKRQRLDVWATPAEAATIKRLAGTARLSVSEYLRNLGLGYAPRTTLDAQAVLDLLHMRGDLGRLGGLLKLWLTDQPGQGAAVTDVRGVLRQIEAAMAQMSEQIAKVELR